MRLATALVAGLVVAGCTTSATGTASPTDPPDPSTSGFDRATRLAAGVVFDILDRPLKGAIVQLDVLDAGRPVPAIVHLEGTSAADGTFSFLVEPTAEVRALAARNDNQIDFRMFAVAPDGSMYPGLEFSRELGADGWQGDVPELLFYPAHTEERP